MRTALGLLFLAFLLCFPNPAHAGNIYGSLWLDGKPVQGAQVRITCSSPHPTQTDNNGSYRVFVTEQGRCVFRVDIGAHGGQTDVASYGNPIKYDFDLIRQNDGNYVLRSR
jgi:hypothetical protein